MLSRVAERMYWFGRYLERAENMARLVNVNSNLLLDLPRMVKQTWGDLINITGNNELFYEKHEKAEERIVVRFLVADPANPGSILSSIRLLRENVRTTREIMPSEAWEQINEFHLFIKNNVSSALRRDGRHEFLDDVMKYCHQITGLLASSMSHGEAYNFTRIGRNLERADMTTRIIDVGCLNLIHRPDSIPETYENILWMNILRSLSGYQMYRQHMLERISGEDVVEFLMRDREFPRSIIHCLDELNDCVSRLPKNDQPLRGITRVQRTVLELDVDKLMTDKLHNFIDELQVDLADIHSLVSQTWFDYSGGIPAEQDQARTG